MNILSIIYSIPPLPDTFSASDTEELPQPASPHNEGHEPHYTNSNHTLAEDHADHDRADDGHAAIGAAMLFEDYQQDEGEEQNYKNQHREPIKNPSVYPITRKQPSPMTENEPTLTDSSATTVVAVESKSMEETMIIETADDLRRILVLDNGVDVISTLEDSQVPLTVDLLLSEIRANVVDPSLYEYHKKCIKSLRRLVDKHGDLPKSLFINDIVRKSSRALIRGGFADIWKGTFRDQEVCLKVCYVSTVATKDNNKIVQGFYKEALIWTQLSHDNLLPFLGVTELFDPDFCLVSPWMENGHIITFLQRNPDHDKLEVITQIAAGMSYLHSLGVVHSDIKGANVLVDDDLNCRLADFGLSTDTNASLASRMSGIKGTYRWMAPELLDVSRLSESEAGGKGKPDKLKRDVYSYGCTVFEIITGEPPFSEMSEPKFVVEVAVNHKRPPRPTDVAWCPDNIWALVQLCWAQETHLRPTASSVHSYLERLVDARRSGLSWERKFPPPVVGS
ncbi:kinase-like protein [Marasmius fiardii PR-910]|nr:kinase-like protein [Marasmius fiardii PR-910]